ncbi:C-type lectin domain family 4 member G-like [Chelmon rostratus]|uniref:C-type lectin domain family 4 member G-like n=1 Tax=Chelmon rostratus TaxID=109905 RepID=UPI001BEBE0CB|nr:C-type lectin domain family 4 member G-like [Chelmon rostratus]
MENVRRRVAGWRRISFTSKLSQVFFNTDGSIHYKIFGQGGGGSERLVLLSLGLLNVVLLIVAVALGINCAKVREVSLHVSHSTATQLITELDYLRGNHSKAVEAEEEAKNALDISRKKHAQLKVEIELQKATNDNYWRQIGVLQVEKTRLQSNISALEGTCGRCLPTWILHNSSCYFFSYIESTNVRKNWPDSRADCVGRGADLIVIDNQEEQKFVSANIGNLRGVQNVRGNGFWIGLTDMDTEGNWVWINNVTEVEPRFWMDGEPNDVGHHGEDCAVAVYSPNNPWKTRNDGSCHTNTLHWICEMKSS